MGTANEDTEQKIETLQKSVRRANVPVEVLNSQNVALLSKNDNYHLLTWVDSPSGPVAKWGREVSAKDLISSKMTGRLPEVKEPTDDIVPWQISSSGISDDAM